MLDAQLVVLVDEDLGEERLVAKPPVRVIAAGVDVGTVRKEAERVVEVGAGVGVVAIVGVDTPGHFVQFAHDAVLFAFEDAQRDGVGVVSLHEPVLFAFESVAVRGEPGEFVGFGGHEAVELVMQHPGEGVLLGRGDLDALVVVLDELLDIVDEHGLAGAVGALGVPTGTHEVAVDVSVAVLRVGDDEPRAALSSMDRAFEVVAVDLGCFDSALVCGEHGLNLVPDLGRDQRWVVALVAGSSVDDIALVVRVCKRDRRHDIVTLGTFDADHTLAWNSDPERWRAVVSGWLTSQ